MGSDNNQFFAWIDEEDKVYHASYKCYNGNERPAEQQFSNTIKLFCEWCGKRITR